MKTDFVPKIVTTVALCCAIYVTLAVSSQVLTIRSLASIGYFDAMVSRVITCSRYIEYCPARQTWGIVSAWATILLFGTTIHYKDGHVTSGQKLVKQNGHRLLFLNNCDMGIPQESNSQPLPSGSRYHRPQ